MTPEEVIDVLSTAAAYDRRTVGEADVHAWMAVIGDLPFEDAQAAVIEHYRTSEEFVMPATIRRIVKAMRERRIPSQHELPAPPPEVADDARAYLAWRKRTQEAIASGSLVVEPLPAIERAREERRARERSPGLRQWSPTDVLEAGGPIPSRYKAAIREALARARRVQEARDAAAKAELEARRTGQGSRRPVEGRGTASGGQVPTDT